MKHMPLIVSVVLSIVLMQVVSQRVGNDLFWSQKQADLSLTQTPCASLQGLSSQHTALPPGAYALWQMCLQTDIDTFSVQILEKELPRIADRDIQNRMPALSPQLLAITMFPTLAQKILTLCAEGQQMGALCDEEKKAQALKAYFGVLNEMLASPDQREQLRAFQYACVHSGSFEEWTGVSPSLVLLLKGCGENREKAIARLRVSIKEEPELLPIIALEVRRLKAVELRDELLLVQSTDPLVETMILFAMQGM